MKFTPNEQVTIAYEEMASQAKPYRADPAGEADRVVVGYEQLERLRDAISSLPSDRQLRPQANIPPPIKALPTGHGGTKIWEALRLVADWFEEADAAIEEMTGVPRDGDIQDDLYMWANELERRFA